MDSISFSRFDPNFSPDKKELEKLYTGRSKLEEAKMHRIKEADQAMKEATENWGGWVLSYAKKPSVVSQKEKQVKELEDGINEKTQLIAERVSKCRERVHQQLTQCRKDLRQYDLDCMTPQTKEKIHQAEELIDAFESHFDQLQGGQIWHRPSEAEEKATRKINEAIDAAESAVKTDLQEKKDQIRSFLQHVSHLSSKLERLEEADGSFQDTDLRKELDELKTKIESITLSAETLKEFEKIGEVFGEDIEDLGARFDVLHQQKLFLDTKKEELQMLRHQVKSTTSSLGQYKTKQMEEKALILESLDGIQKEIGDFNPSLENFDSCDEVIGSLRRKLEAAQEEIDLLKRLDKEFERQSSLLQSHQSDIKKFLPQLHQLNIEEIFPQKSEELKGFISRVLASIDGYRFSRDDGFEDFMAKLNESKRTIGEELKTLEQQKARYDRCKGVLDAFKEDVKSLVGLMENYQTTWTVVKKSLEERAQALLSDCDLPAEIHAKVFAAHQEARQAKLVGLRQDLEKLMQDEMASIHAAADAERKKKEAIQKIANLGLVTPATPREQPRASSVSAIIENPPVNTRRSEETVSVNARRQEASVTTKKSVFIRFWSWLSSFFSFGKRKQS